MKEIPNIISIKDLLYIEDMLNWNLIMNKKLYSYLECICDSETEEILTKAKKMHAKHYKACAKEKQARCKKEAFGTRIRIFPCQTGGVLLLYYETN